MVFGLFRTSRPNQQKTEDSSKFKNFLAYQLFFLKIGGILPSESISSSPWKLRVYNVFSFLSVVWFIPSNLAQIYAFFEQEGSVSGKVDSLFEITATLNNFCISLYMVLNRKSLQLVIAKVETSFKEFTNKLPLGAEHIHIMDEGKKQIKLFSTIFTVANMSTIFLWSITPIISWAYDRMNTEERGDTVDVEEKVNWEHFCYKTWLPPNAEELPTYLIVWVCEAFVVYVLLIDNTGYNSMYYAITIFTTAHFKILNKLMENVDQYIPQEDLKQCQELSSGQSIISGENFFEEGGRFRKESDVVNGMKYGAKNGRDENDARNGPLQTNGAIDAESYLIDCIKYHQALLEFCEDVENVFNPLLFIFFTLNGAMMCLTVFQSSVGAGDGGYFKFVCAMISVWVPMFLICWFGERLTEQTQAVEQTTYGFLWYNSSQRFKDYTQFVIMRAQKPVQLTAGKFFTVSLDGFANIAHTAYAYYTFLKQARDSPE